MATVTFMCDLVDATIVIDALSETVSRKKNFLAELQQSPFVLNPRAMSSVSRSLAAAEALLASFQAASLAAFDELFCKDL